MSFLVAIGVAVVVSCGSDNGPQPLPPPAILSASVTSLASNVLAADVSAQLTDADSIVVRYRRASDPASQYLLSLKALVTASASRALVLGLLPDTDYMLHVVAYGPGGTTTGDEISIRTGPLPMDMPSFTVSGSDPSPGFVVMAAGQFGVVIDNAGRVVWYHRFPDGPGLNFMAQPTGIYAARPTTADAFDDETWVEISPAGEQLHTADCAGQLNPRPHDMIALHNGGHWLICDETRTMNLAAYGGNPQARVTGSVIQQVDSDGNLVSQWSVFDHFAIGDLDPAALAGEVVNWTHGNAIELDVDGNLIVSFRNLSEITKINVASGAVMWRLGGKRNQFALQGGTTPFVQQHSVRVTGANQFVIFDNLGAGNESRAERWVINPNGLTALSHESVGSSPPALAPVAGGVQPLPGGRLLVSYGMRSIAEEYDASGTAVWRVESSTGFVFRAQRINSLYNPGLALSR
jgi:hypothetical protein